MGKIILNGIEYTKGGGGSGGHTIVDQSGNTMQSRTGLQFIGASVTDDSVNNKTVVTVTSGVHYSTSEQIIGTWIDGKPLYEKVVDIPNTSVINNSFVYPHGISDYEMAMIDKAFTVDYASGSVFTLTLTDNTDKALSIRLDPTNIFFRGSNFLNIVATRHLYVIIRYTKTTD